jgi:hypothetical protein
MKGDDDDNLIFPCKAYIEVNLLNQLMDHNHCRLLTLTPQMTVTCFGKRVRSGDIGNGIGSRNVHLQCNRQNNGPYLINNCLFLRVDQFKVD